MHVRTHMQKMSKLGDLQLYYYSLEDRSIVLCILSLINFNAIKFKKNFNVIACMCTHRRIRIRSLAVTHVYEYVICKDERENVVNGKRLRYDLQSVGMLGFGCH